MRLGRDCVKDLSLCIVLHNKENLSVIISIIVYNTI